ncbi:Type IV secretory pathway, VirD4 component, partial [human gut metagenome]
TTGYVYPNLLEASASYVVLDPKGEVCRNTAGYLQSKGYAVKVLNLVNPSRSWGYNPFAYIRKDTDTDAYAEDDIQKIVTAIYKATTAPNSQTIDPFWDEAGKMLLSALMYLLYYFGAEDEKNFPYLMNLIRAGRIENSEDDEQRSALDILFQSIEQRYPDHICVRYYKNATSGAGKTQQSVQITLLARLQKFEISSVASMSIQDELELSII